MPIFKKASKTSINIRLGMFGPSGAGKTLSSLAIAKELGGRVALIDSEYGSSSRYADLFDFDVFDLPKRSLEDYVKAIEAAGIEGYDICIIDSFSHAWLSALEEMDRLSPSQKMQGWAKINPRLARLQDTILKSPAHIIATFRAKTEWAMEQINGRVKPQEVGVGPVFRDGIAYEFDIFAYISDRTLEIQKSRCLELQGQSFVNPGKEFADVLKTWISGFPESTPEIAPPASEVPEKAVDPKIYRRWQSYDDAIDWAQNLLPTYCRSELEKLFDEIPPVKGRKALVWKQQIERLAAEQDALT